MGNNDWRLGEIISDTEEVIAYPLMSVAAFREHRTVGSLNLRTVDEGTRFSFIDLSVRIGGKSWIASGNFYNNVIICVALELESEHTKPVDIRKRNEKREREFYDGLVFQRTGKKAPAVFDWGYITVLPSYNFELPFIAVRYREGDWPPPPETKKRVW